MSTVTSFFPMYVPVDNYYITFFISFWANRLSKHEQIFFSLWLQGVFCQPWKIIEALFWTLSNFLTFSSDYGHQLDMGLQYRVELIFPYSNLMLAAAIPHGLGWSLPWVK